MHRPRICPWLPAADFEKRSRISVRACCVQVSFKISLLGKRSLNFVSYPGCQVVLSRSCKLTLTLWICKNQVGRHAQPRRKKITPVSIALWRQLHLKRRFLYIRNKVSPNCEGEKLKTCLGGGSSFKPHETKAPFFCSHPGFSIARVPAHTAGKELGLERD